MDDDDVTAAATEMTARRIIHKLTYAVISELSGKDVREVITLEASRYGIAELEDMNVCTSLCKLNLSHNAITSLVSLEYTTSLTLLNLSSNQLNSMDHLERLQRLSVLNLAHNNLIEINGLTTLTNLKALVLNNNRIRTMSGLSSLVQLNTLVLSHNLLSDITGIKRLTALAKLSLSHNELRVIPDEIRNNHALAEIRLNSNKIQGVKESILALQSLKVIDLGNNRIANADDVKMFGRLPHLRNLTIAGNRKLCYEGYEKVVHEALPQLIILDNKRLFQKKGKKAAEAKMKHEVSIANEKVVAHTIDAISDKEINLEASIAKIDHKAKTEESLHKQHVEKKGKKTSNGCNLTDGTTETEEAPMQKQHLERKRKKESTAVATETRKPFHSNNISKIDSDADKNRKHVKVSAKGSRRYSKEDVEGRDNQDRKHIEQPGWEGDSFLQEFDDKKRNSKVRSYRNGKNNNSNMKSSSLVDTATIKKMKPTKHCHIDSNTSNNKNKKLEASSAIVKSKSTSVVENESSKKRPCIEREEQPTKKQKSNKKQTSTNTSKVGNGAKSNHGAAEDTPAWATLDTCKTAQSGVVAVTNVRENDAPLVHKETIAGGAPVDLFTMLNNDYTDRFGIGGSSQW